MPTYDYKCDDCKVVREEFVHSPKVRWVTCDDCSGVMQQQFPAPALIGMMKCHWKFNHGLGKKFESSKEIDAELKAKGMEPV